MDLASLEIFRTVVREGGVTRAATQLHRVQSNVTTRIRQLEASLGVQLFVREGKRMVLTPAGQTLLAYADDILRLAAEARQAVQPREPHGRLRIASMESTAASRLPALLATLHQRWPRVQLELVTLPTRQALQALSRFEVDCAFLAETACLAPMRASLTTLPAFAEELVLIAHRAHPPIRRAADVRTPALLAFEPGCAYRQLVEDWFEADAVVPSRVLELGSYHAIIACAAAGIGVALVPRSVLELYSNTPEVSVHALGKPGRVDTVLAWHRDMAGPALQGLVQVLGEPHAVAPSPTGEAVAA
ncbi:MULTISPECIES: LysR family transcriptional regulator [Ralstonia solanacearum species complex]|uniref:HTH lysR-type domain-containing protein n=3 Tax=Ralstonia solanacearum TaxID=305 RepID=A0ABF7REI6_RALSL|nr:LysR family transcriptional regulator [Ralstonia solanacearum]ALF87396.1 HTH-type transcriptional regulator GltR [Ralstonia solanacearum]ATI26927.1 LysR family transcriptional regulator [Ralstonia solanacearum]KEI33028.1 LysR family transcriptional regulator [Ralstonia solanacearum]KFX29687.1 LysR family transcriptional regulator [Ralstonia solanacearum]KFX79802.1 LysR family transcriptional regulator [Ralstonia solanacearum]